MPHRIISFYTIFAFLILSNVGSIFATELNINPVSFYFNHSNKIQTLEIENLGNIAVTLQLDAKTWHQNDVEENIYQPTNDFLVTPPLFNLPPGKKQLVRIALLKSEKNSDEKAYRLIIRELLANSAENNKNLHMTLHVLLPIFVEPIKKQSLSYLYNIVSVNADQANVIVKNTSNQHLLINQLEILNSDGQVINQNNQVIAYVLPNMSKTIVCKLSEPLSASSKVNIKFAS